MRYSTVQTCPVRIWRGAKLHGTLLWSANLSRVNLRDTNLSNECLRGLELPGADLSNADLSQTDLHGVDLSGAVLKNANLCRANLFGANLSEVSLQDANLSDTEFEKPRPFPPTLSESDKRPKLRLTQAPLDEARADPASPPHLNGVVDAETGKPLVWRSKPLDEDG